MRAARWSDNDHYLGPFICFERFLSHSRSASGRATMKTEPPRFGSVSPEFSFLAVLPGWVIRPERRKVYPQWDEATVERLGVIGIGHRREYSIGVFDGHLSVNYGRVTDDSSTEQRWGCFLPWTNGVMSVTAFTGSMANVWTEPKPAKWDAYHAAKEACPRVAFEFDDFDNERLTAKTLIERSVNGSSGPAGANGFPWFVPQDSPQP